MRRKTSATAVGVIRAQATVFLSRGIRWWTVSREYADQDIRLTRQQNLAGRPNTLPPSREGFVSLARLSREESG